LATATTWASFQRRRRISSAVAPRSPSGAAVRESGTVNAQSVLQRSQAHAWMRPVSLVCRTAVVVSQ
jgi:hypothetical protein